MANDTPAEAGGASTAAPPVWLSAASYWQPPLYTVTAWLEHAPFGYWIVDALRPQTIVELGTHYGYSYFVFCEGIKRLGLDARAFALDSWEGDDQAGLYGEEVYAFVADTNAHYGDFSTLMRGYFDDSLPNFADGSIDLLHIDGRHGYDDVKHDFSSWLPKMSSRGVVIFHDIAEHQDGFGVWQFWEELESQYPSFAFGHAHGLGVLGVGQDQSERMQEFFRAARADATTVRRTYEELGAALVGISRAGAISEENDALRGEIERLGLEIDAVKAELQQTKLDRDDVILGASNQLDEFMASTSWKLTAPVRRLGSAVHRRRAR